MVEQRGTHSTSVTRAKNIRENGGFRLSDGGRVGPGVYFWHLNAVAEMLARCWHIDQLKKGAYRGDAEQTLAIIYAKLSALEDEWFDLEDQAFKDKLAEIMMKKKKQGTVLSDDSYINLITLLIESFEVKFKIKAKILRVRLSPPESANPRDYPMKLLGAPLCYVARDASCITIEKAV